MKIGRAFPGILSRQHPEVKAEYPLLTVLYLLRMIDVDAVPIMPVAEKRARAVFGFSSLPKLMDLDAKRFEEFLRGPCEAASDQLALLRAHDELETLLEAFESRRLGFALVYEGNPSRAGLVSLADVLTLFRRGLIKTDMDAVEVSTPIFSMPEWTTTRSALQAMFGHRYRRVFLKGKEAYVSDRSLMGYLFRPAVLEEIGQESGKDFLARPIAEAERSVPGFVSSESSVKAAALRLARDRGGCLVTAKKRVVTPWDVVMKPWLSGSLTIT